MFTHAKLGNLVLLPSTASSARLTSLSEYEAKASFYTSCGGTEAFPSFTGGERVTGFWVRVLGVEGRGPAPLESVSEEVSGLGVV